MAKELETLGFVELTDDIAQMARALSDEYGEEWKAKAEGILNEAAQPVLEAALQNAPRRTGKLHDAIKVSKVVPRKGNSGYSIKIGNQEGSDAFYARMVEFGHGGPKPAPPHPFMQPAYDTTREQAYAIIRARLAEAISKIGG